MAHCNNQMTDFVPLTPIGLNSSVYVMNRDTARSGVRFGLACATNGSNFACSYCESPDALVYYDADGNVLWTSAHLLDANLCLGEPLIQADGSVVVGDDQHLYKFNNNGTVAWSTPSPGGQPNAVVTTPNGAIVSAPEMAPVNSCPQNNCQLVVTVNNRGSGYTNAAVILSGGDCPGAAATATVSKGQVTAVTLTSQGPACIIQPDVVIQGDGSYALASALLYSAAPVAAYDGITGKLVGSMFLYQHGNRGPYYITTNTPCVNDASYPNRVYVSTNLTSNKSQGALWALDIDPANTAQPITPAWHITFDGPSGASPLCVSNDVYFDGAGFVPGDHAGTTIFGAQDGGASGTLLFHVSLGPNAGIVDTNFAIDPRPAGGFWHQVQGDPHIYHRDGSTGALIEKLDTSTPLVANGAPPGNYWDAGVFTMLGTADHPYLILSEYAPRLASYVAMYDVTNGALVWALPLYPANSPFLSDTEEGMAALAIDAQGRSVVAVASRYNGAYFISDGPGTLALSTASLHFGNEAVGATSAFETVTLTNTASAVLNISGISASGDFAQSNNCAAPLPAGISCSITVSFSPTSTGPRTGAVTITSNAAGSPQTVTVSGTGITGQPAVSLSRATLSFPSQPAGTTSGAQTVVLTNGGTAGLAIASIAASGETVQSNACPASVAPGANCIIAVMFAPTGTGPRSGAVTISSNAGGGPVAITVTGTGTQTPSAAVRLSYTRLVFPAQMAGSASAPQSVTLTNAGTATVSITNIAASGDASQTNTCGASLAAGATCLISVAFAPIAVGARNGAITITDNAAGSPQTIAISGTGTGHPVPLLGQPLAPASQLPGAPGFTLTVHGGPFLPGALVDWNGAPLATSLISSTQLAASVPASAVAVAGTAWINLSNPGPGGGLSNTAWFPVSTPSAELFFKLSNLPAGAGPQALATADFNADGRLDLAVANSGANSVAILLGNGDGTFAPAAYYGTGSHPMAVATGDFNGDGKPDLAVANMADNTVSILLGNGNGTFAAAKPYPTGNGPIAIAVADFTGDGNLDAAVANWADNTISILPGSGTGLLGAHLDYVAGQAPSALAAGDFNADGNLDLAVTNDFSGGTVSVLLGSPGGAFQPPVSYPTGDSVALVAADCNADGILDLAAINRMQQTISVLLGLGDGTFQPVPAALACPANLQADGCQMGPGPAGLAVGALNGDGSLELAVVNSNAGTVSILDGQGNGIFRKTTDYATAAGPAGIVMGDFNGDGSLDLAVAALGANTISVLLQAPVAITSANNLSFGNVPIGASASQTVTLTNGGSALLRIASVTVSGNFSQTNTCGTTVAAGAACAITVTFAPTTTGRQTGRLSITDNAQGSPQKINLSGTGVSNST